MLIGCFSAFPRVCGIKLARVNMVGPLYCPVDRARFKYVQICIGYSVDLYGLLVIVRDLKEYLSLR